MFVEPDVQVKPVKDPTPTEADFWHFQLIKQRDPDTEIDRSLFLGQATNRRQRQTDFIHVNSPLIAARIRCERTVPSALVARGSYASCIRAYGLGPVPGRADRR